MSAQVTKQCKEKQRSDSHRSQGTGLCQTTCPKPIEKSLLELSSEICILKLIPSSDLITAVGQKRQDAGGVTSFCLRDDQGCWLSILGLFKMTSVPLYPYLTHTQFPGPWSLETVLPSVRGLKQWPPALPSRN